MLAKFRKDSKSTNEHLMGTSLIGDPFWKRFCVSVHSCSNLLDSEKLVYFQPSLKDGSVKNVVEGLPHFGLY